MPHTLTCCVTAQTGLRHGLLQGSGLSRVDAVCGALRGETGEHDTAHIVLSTEQWPTTCPGSGFRWSARGATLAAAAGRWGKRGVAPGRESSAYFSRSESDCNLAARPDGPSMTLPLSLCQDEGSPEVFPFTWHHSRILSDRPLPIVPQAGQVPLLASCSWHSLAFGVSKIRYIPRILRY